MMTKNGRPRILAVVGPTASGKSALALALAERLGGEIVSCDSMQVYRGMDIGTAKPTPAEQARVPHHLIDILEPEQPFSAMDFADAAGRAIRDICMRGRVPVLCGGTGLYLDTLLRGPEVETPGADPAVRAELQAIADTQGAQALHGMLREVDPAGAAAVHPNNVRRVIRALEVFRSTGLPKSEWDRRSAERESPYDATVIGLEYADRALLYDRIDRRVDAMLAEGLVAETEMLLKRGVFRVSPTARGAIGYKELLPYCLGEESLEQATETLKIATRRYAKRQMTWFRAKPYVQWIRADADGYPRKSEEIVNISLDLFSLA